MSNNHDIEENIRGAIKIQIENLPAIQTGRQPYLFTRPPTIGPVMEYILIKKPKSAKNWLGRGNGRRPSADSDKT